MVDLTKGVVFAGESRFTGVGNGDVAVTGFRIETSMPLGRVVRSIAFGRGETHSFGDFAIYRPVTLRTKGK